MNILGGLWDFVEDDQSIYSCAWKKIHK